MDSRPAQLGDHQIALETDGIQRHREIRDLEQYVAEVTGAACYHRSMAQPKPHYRPAEYLALERESRAKHEFQEGQIFAMAGASRRHNLICLNIGAALWTQLRERDCEVYTSDMRVLITATGLYTYPDVVVVCEGPEFEDAELDTLLNPTLLVEVLSESTADYDRGAKFEQYRTVPSLQEVLHVAQHEVHCVCYRRQRDNSWILSETRNRDGRMPLSSIGAELEMAVTYAKVSFETGGEPRAES